MANTDFKSDRIVLSIIIPCYNQGEYILDAISSVEKYQEAIYEIIIINDGSTEVKTQEILKELQAKKYNVINQDNLGLAKARNNGIALAKGQYILALDADNKIRTNYITEGIKILDSHPDVGVVYGRVQYFGEYIGVSDILNFDIDKLILKNFIDACTVFRKQLWHDCGGFDPKMPIQGYEDWDFWLSAIEKGWKFYHIPEVTFDYRVRLDSMASFCNIPENRKALMYYICNKHINLYRDKLAYVLSEKEFALLNEQINLSKCHLQLQQADEEQERFKLELTKQAQAEFEQSQSQLQLTQAEFEQSQSQLQLTQTEFEHLQSQLQLTQAKFEHLQSQLQLTQAKFEQSQSQLQLTQAKFEQSQSQLQLTQAELVKLQTQLQLTRKEDNLLESQLQQTQRELELSKGTIAAMETSKFWKLRVIWFKFKALIKKVISVFKNKAGIIIPLNFRETESYLPGIDITIDAIPTKKPLVKYSATVDVIICVHNALDDVKLCLESVLRYSRMPYSLILVDDGSREETCKYLSDFANSQDATLIRNHAAKGYTFAANQGLRYSQAEYAILLNSDTIVTPGWLDRMVACGESDPQIGIIGPLSNTASWQSIPEISHQGDWAENKLPESISVADMGILVAEYSALLYPRIPFLNGFCLAIKRSTIENIGYFDEDTFGAGYGEENDYCLRSRQAGWQLAIADDTYVYHSQSRSYSNERRKELCDRADKALVAKHGQQVVSDGVSICRFDRVLEGIRIRNKVMLERQKFLDEGKKLWEGKRVLIILPIMEPGGGGNVIFQEAIAMQKMGVDVRILNFTSHRETFEKSYPDSTIPIIYVEKESQIAELLVQYDAVLATLYKSVYWLDSLVADANQPIKGYYIQDFEPYFFPNNSEGFKTAWKSYTYYPDLVRITKTEWNHDILKIKIGVESSVIGASVNLDLFRPCRRQEPNWPQRPLRIAAMIRPSSPRRNAKFTMQVLQKIYQKHENNIEIIIFGCSSDELKSLELKQNFPWRNAGILTSPQLAFLLNEIDIFADFSNFQAMGLTAMEAMACGVAVIVPKQGGASSFAKDKHNSLIVNTSSKRACFNSLNRLILDENLRLKLQQQGLQDICQYFPEKVAYNILKILFNANY